MRNQSDQLGSLMLLKQTLSNADILLFQIGTLCLELECVLPIILEVVKRVILILLVLCRLLCRVSFLIAVGGDTARQRLRQRFQIRLGRSHVIMHIINDFIAFGDMGNRFGREILRIGIHVHLDVIKGHLNRSHDFRDELSLLDHLWRELELISVQDGLVTQHFLSLLFSNHLLICLLCIIQAQRCRIKRIRKEEPRLPITRI